MAEHKKHHKFTHAHVEFHKDGTHTHHFVHEDGPEHDEKGATSSHDDLMDKFMDHTSAPNPGEAEANAGDHGVEPGAAAAAGLPAPMATA